MSRATGAASERRCPTCLEPIAAGTRVCPRCAEPVTTGTAERGLRLAGFGLAGAATALFLAALLERVLRGPAPDLALVLRSLRYIEAVLTAGFLVLLAFFLRKRPG